MSGERLILASKSAARRTMLEGAGVPFSVQVADVDEGAVKAVHDSADAAGLAVELARIKALAVSRHDPEAWVLGADQTLAFAGGLVSKAPSMTAARARLAASAGSWSALTASSSTSAT